MAHGLVFEERFRARNLVTKQKADLACKGTDNLAEADFAKRAVTFMYTDPEFVYLLDSQDPVSTIR